MNSLYAYMFICTLYRVGAAIAQSLQGFMIWGLGKDYLSRWNLHCHNL